MPYRNWIKRKIARRKLKRKCICCDRGFKKGDVYYLEKTVYDVVGSAFCEWLICPKCKYKEDRSAERFEKFAATCFHPPEFERDIYSCSGDPVGVYCGLCGRELK